MTTSPTLVRKAKVPGPIITEPRLLVFREKHGVSYYLVNDDNMLYAAALKVLTQRFETGYWYYKPAKKPEAPDFTQEQVATMPASMQAGANEKLSAYTRALRRYDVEVEDYESIKKAVKAKDGKLAWQSLCAHQNAEYEGFRLECLETV